MSLVPPKSLSYHSYTLPGIFHITVLIYAAGSGGLVCQAIPVRPKTHANTHHMFAAARGGYPGAKIQNTGAHKKAFSPPRALIQHPERGCFFSSIIPGIITVYSIKNLQIINHQSISII